MRRSLLLVLTVALVWRLLMLASIQSTPLAALHTWEESDMATFWHQAEGIAEGDRLAREPYYPYHRWMTVFPSEEWARWHPPAMFYQPPLYSYGLAGLIRLGLDAPAAARWAQVALGVLACGLMWGLGRRLLGEAAGTVAGLILAVNGPLLAAESQLLRDGPILCWTLGILWLGAAALAGMRKCRCRPAAARSAMRWRGYGLGLLLGGLAMLHEAALFLGGAVALVGATGARRLGRGARPQWLALLALGTLIGFGPLLARNLVVGAPWGPRYFGSLLAFATANHPAVPAEDLTVPLPADEAGREAFAQTMRWAGGRPGRLLAAVAGAWWPHWDDWAGRWGRRFAALSIGPEHNENLCYAYFQRHVPILALALDFRFLGPLAGAGLFALGWRRWRHRLAAADGLALVALHGLLTLGLIGAVQPFGRYRLMLLPVLALLAALTLVRGWGALRRRRIGRLAVLCLLTGGLAAGQMALGRLPSLAGLGGLRPVDFIVASRILVRQGDPAAAAAQLTEGLRFMPRHPEMTLEHAVARGMALQQEGEYAAAAAQYEQALALNPEHGLARLGLATAREGRALTVQP